MPESLSPSPERNAEPQSEHLRALGGQFADDLEHVKVAKIAIMKRAMGDEDFDMHLFEMEFDSDDEPDLDEVDRELSPLELKQGEVGSALYALEDEALEGGFVGFADDCQCTDTETYHTATGEERLRYTEYRVRDGVIVADEHDFVQGSIADERRRQIELETSVGVNGQAVEAGDAQDLTKWMSAYRARLEKLLASDEPAFRHFVDYFGKEPE